MIIRYPGFRPGLSSPGPTARMGSIRCGLKGRWTIAQGETLGGEPPHPNVPGSIINDYPEDTGQHGTALPLIIDQLIIDRLTP